jgi:chitinase
MVASVRLKGKPEAILRVPVESLPTLPQPQNGVKSAIAVSHTSIKVRDAAPRFRIFLHPFPAFSVSFSIMGRLFSGLLQPGVPACLSAFLLLLSLTARGVGLPEFRQHSAHQLVVGYFPQWGIYYPQPYYVKTLVTNGSAARLDQINYSQGSVTGGHCSLADPKADLNTTFTAETSVNGKADQPDSPFRGYFHQLKELKRRYPRLKILISLEGKASDFARDATPENRSAFVASCVDTFIRGHYAPGVSEPGLFDGVDIDWESPQSNDAANFSALIKEFRQQMSAARPGLKLSIAVGQDPQMLPGTDFSAIAPLVDQVGIMNYDYAGPWSKYTGFVAPLFSSRRSGSIEASIASYKARGVPERKLLMGLPFYGYSWTAVSSMGNGLFQPGQGVRGDRPYNYIRTLAWPFATYRDPRSQAPWLYDGQTFWTYEDPVSVRYKVSYARDQHLGGVMIWELSEDTSDAELLTTAYRSMRHPLKNKVFAKMSKPESSVPGP